MSKKSDTPVAVRVARWTAITAAITALGTIGNTFMEKRPWFLGGDEATASAKSNEEAKVETSYHRSNVENLSRRVAEVAAEEPAANLKSKEKLREHGVVTESADTAVAMSAFSADDAAGAGQVAMAVGPDFSLWDKIRMFIDTRPIASIIIGLTSLSFLAWMLIEFFFDRKKKKESKVLFDSPKP